MTISVRMGSKTRGFYNVTQAIDDLSFSKRVPGGFAGATFRLRGSIDRRRFEREAFNEVIITDARHGGVIWQGRLEDPGRTMDASGPTWDCVAIGPSAHVRDRHQAYIVIDQDVSHWRSDIDTSKGIETSTGNAFQDQFGDNPAINIRYPQGLTIANNYHGGCGYPLLQRSGQLLGGVRTTWQTPGVTLGNDWLPDVTTRDDTFGIGAGETTAQNANVSAATITHNVISQFPATRNIAELRLRYLGTATTIPSPNFELSFCATWVHALLLDKEGNERYLTYPSRFSCVPHEIVEDLLGRFLSRYDGPNAYVDTSSTAQIDQMTYQDGTTPGAVLDDLMLIAPDHYWAAWENNDEGFIPRARFEWRPWPTEVRYEATVEDGFSSPQSQSEVYNRVAVRYIDFAGREEGGRHVKVYTSYVPSLDDNGITRDAPLIDLGDEIGSEQVANIIGAKFLEAHKVPTNSGQLTISRPILDRISNRIVYPHEIMPGTLVRVRGIESYPDSLNASGEDGATVFRLVSTNYSHNSRSATCELSSPAQTLDVMLAALMQERRKFHSSGQRKQ